MGLLNNLLPFCLIVWGQARIGSGLASILNATTPLFAVIVAHLLTEDENISVNKLAGVALGFVGVAIMIGSAAWSGLDGTCGHNWRCWRRPCHTPWPGFTGGASRSWGWRR